MARYRAAPNDLRPDDSESSWIGSRLVLTRVADFYRRMLPAVARGQLVDLGCGNSPLRPFYDPLVDDSWSLDWPSSLHDQSPEVFADLQRGVPLAGNSVDTVLLSDVLEHLAVPGQLLAEAERILRPGGRIIGSVPFMYWLHEEPHDYFRYTEHGLRSLLAEAGFTEITIEVLGGGVDVLVDSFGKMLTAVPVVGRVAASVLVGTWLGLSSVSIVARAHGRIERLMPLEYGFVATRPAEP